MKENRHQAILKIIQENEIYTQEGMLEKLQEAGFSVTQATVSRDIKKLNLIKALTPDGKYKYVCHVDPSLSAESGKYQSVFSEAVTAVDYAINMVVVKCHVGFADAACSAIDLMPLDGMVGSIAGDDTIFLLMRTEQQAKQVVGELERLFNK